MKPSGVSWDPQVPDAGGPLPPAKSGTPRRARGVATRARPPAPTGDLAPPGNEDDRRSLRLHYAAHWGRKMKAGIFLGEPIKDEWHLLVGV